MKKLFGRRRQGGTTIIMIGVTVTIFVFALFFLELLQLYNYQYAVEVRAQRAINSCVEYAMDDNYRADGLNFMDADAAADTLFTYLNTDLNVNSRGSCIGNNGETLYTVSYGTPVYHTGKDGVPAGIEIDITVNMFAGLGRFFGWDGYEWTNEFSSTNFRTDDDERKGIWP